MNPLPTLRALGKHILAEFYNCDPNVLNNATLIEHAMTQAALHCEAAVVDCHFHQFSPQGISGVVVIQASHLAIHTWPELGYAAVDLFINNPKTNPHIAYEFLKDHLKSGRASYTELLRGADQLPVLQPPPVFKQNVYMSTTVLNEKGGV